MPGKICHVFPVNLSDPLDTIAQPSCRHMRFSPKHPAWWYGKSHGTGWLHLHVLPSFDTDHHCSHVVGPS